MPRLHPIPTSGMSGFDLPSLCAVCDETADICPATPPALPLWRRVFAWWWAVYWRVCVSAVVVGFTGPWVLYLGFGWAPQQMIELWRKIP